MVEARAQDEAYGVCLGCAGADTFDYLCGVQVADLSTIPSDWARMHIAAHTYAVFRHYGHVSSLRETVKAVFEEWLPDSGHELAETSPDEPDFLERYGPEFDPETGMGGIEVCIPVHARQETGKPGNNKIDMKCPERCRSFVVEMEGDTMGTGT
jgi:AraC family transcriptional regulator